ncbi:MAG: hypothetical protein AB7O67_07225 [Vicinamibacterales bacterium]
MRVLPLLLLLATASVASAQTWSASVLGGAAFSGDSTVTRGAAAAAVGLMSRRGVGLEAEAGIAGLTPAGQDDSWLRAMTGSLVWQAPRAGRLQAYLSAGAAITSQSTGPPAYRGLKHALVLGGGALVGRGTWRLRMDVRHIHVDNAPNVWRAGMGVMVLPGQG